MWPLQLKAEERIKTTFEARLVKHLASAAGAKS
jgi:hypothetical protein